MRFLSVQTAVSLALALGAATASAEEKMVEISGFGTAGIAFTDTNKAEFIRGSQPTGADSSGDVGLDSLAAIQATVHLSDRISGTAQLMARRQYEKGFELDVPVAFVKAAVTSDFSVRVGRLPLAVFLVSDYRQVGYVNTFMRPPVEVYGQVPLDSVDGVDALYSHNVGPVNLNLQGFYGKTDVSLSAADISVRKFGGGNITANWGPVTLRYARVEDHLTLSGITAADQLISTVGAVGFPALANSLATNDVVSTFTAYGAALDWHNWIGQAEWTQADSGGYLGDSTGKYALVGYRIAKFTPYASYAVRKMASPRTNSTIPHTGPLAALSYGVDALIHGQQQNSTAIGIRWDVHDSVDIKLQVDRVHPDGNGLFTNVQPGFSGAVTVMALAVDFVF